MELVNPWNDCASGVVQAAALLNFFVPSGKSDGGDAARLCTVKLSMYYLIAKAGGRKFTPPTGLASSDQVAVMCPETCGAYGVFAPGCAPP
eukprot:scaffold93222_cov36-Phaeocystis_antarctica.AAC.1